MRELKAKDAYLAYEAEFAARDLRPGVSGQPASRPRACAIISLETQLMARISALARRNLYMDGVIALEPLRSSQTMFSTCLALRISPRASGFPRIKEGLHRLASALQG